MHTQSNRPRFSTQACSDRSGKPNLELQISCKVTTLSSAFDAKKKIPAAKDPVTTELLQYIIGVIVTWCVKLLMLLMPLLSEAEEKKKSAASAVSGTLSLVCTHRGSTKFQLST